MDVVVSSSLFACARPFVWNSIDVGGRMAVVKLANGDVWVHSPVELDARTRQAVDALGRVAHIVSPNYEHLKYAAQWKQAYPDATLYGCPGLKTKKPDIPYDCEVSNVAPEAWLGEFEVAWFDSERAPVIDEPFFNEVVFYHKPTKSLMVTDVFWNYPGGATIDGIDVPLGTKAWKFGMDKVYAPFYRKIMIVDEAKYAETVRLVTETWAWDIVVPCHGPIVRGGIAREAVREHLR